MVKMDDFSTANLGPNDCKSEKMCDACQMYNGDNETRRAPKRILSFHGLKTAQIRLKTEVPTFPPVVTVTLAYFHVLYAQSSPEKLTNRLQGLRLQVSVLHIRLRIVVSIRQGWPLSLRMVGMVGESSTAFFTEWTSAGHLLVLIHNDRLGEFQHRHALHVPFFFKKKKKEHRRSQGRETPSDTALSMIGCFVGLHTVQNADNDHQSVL